jgi:hypothetical protein
MGLELGGMGLWTYPVKPPEGPYAYILDDEDQAATGIRAILRLSRSHLTLIARHGVKYILLGDRAKQQKAGLSFHISIEPKGMGYMVVHCHAEIDLQTWEISNLICHPSVEQAARAKLEKVIEFLKRSQQEAPMKGH